MTVNPATLRPCISANGTGDGAPAPEALFRVTHFRDLGDVHEKTWLIGDLLASGELTVIYGAPGSGKSVLLGDMAAHVAGGLDWFGRRVTQGLVVYVAAERASLVKRRLVAWRERYQHTEVPLLVVEGSFNFCRDTTDAEEIIRIAQEAADAYGLPSVWVIIDTKAQVMAGADPNSDKDAFALIASAALIQRTTGAHVSLVDHVPHYAPGRMKGSGAIAGAADGSFWVQKVVQGHHCMVIGSKPPNDGPDELELSFSLESIVIHTNAAGEQTSAPVVIACEKSIPAAPNGKPKLRLKPGAVKLQQAFGRLYDAGQTLEAPSAPGVRPGTLAVSLSNLRVKAFELGLSPDVEPTEPGKERERWRNNRNQAWKRALEELETLRLFRVESNLVWEPGRPLPVTNGDENGDEQ